MLRTPKRKVKARITAILKNGFGVDVDGEKGFIRRRDLSWEDKYINQLPHYKLNDTVDALVLGIDPLHGNQLILSIKHAIRDPWEEFLPKYYAARNRNDNLIVEGTVYEVLDSRIYVELKDKNNAVLYKKDISRLFYYGELALSTIFKLGDQVRGVAINIDNDRETVEISIDRYLDIMFSETKVNERPVTLADIYGDKMIAVFGYPALEQPEDTEDDDLGADVSEEGIKIKRVLIIDDKRVDAEEAQKTLEDIGIKADIHVYKKETGLPTVDHIFSYDAVFIDKNLGDQDGHSLAVIILQSNNEFPIFIITGEAETSTLEKLKKAEIHEDLYILSKPLADSARMMSAMKWAEASAQERRDLIKERNIRLEYTPPPTSDQNDEEKIQKILTALCDSESKKAFLVEFDLISREMTLFRSHKVTGTGWSEYKSTMRHTPLVDIMANRQADILLNIHEKRKKHLPPEIRDIISMAGCPVSVYGEARYGLFLVDSSQSLTNHDYQSVVQSAERMGFLIERALFKEEMIREQRYKTTGVLYESMRHDIVGIMGSLKSFDIMKLWDRSKPMLSKTDQEGETARTKFRTRLEAMDRAIKDAADLFEFFSSVERRGLEVASVDIKKIINKVINIIRTTEGNSGVEIVFENIGPDNLTMRVSSIKLVQILRNLIFNACQQIREYYLPIKKVNVTLDYKSSETELPIKIIVRDTGPGIHRVDFAKIFNPLYTTRREGMGLGLFICRQLAEEMGGKVEIVSSYILTGSEFLISLPRGNA